VLLNRERNKHAWRGFQRAGTLRGMDINIRPTRAEDLPFIDGLGTCNYPENYFEGQASFASKITGNPETCWVATADGYVIGYVIAFPYVLGEAYPIDHVYTPVAAPDCLYLHDLCVSPLWRKLGVARRLAQTILDGQWNTVALVAVMNSQGFWETLGFGVERWLDYYGLPAAYMVRKR
jgi:ribosomal protein S18 acetylase RimI-like enzyme